MVVSIDGLRKLAKPLKQPERLIYESWASTSQSCFCPMLTATDVNREFLMKYESLTWTGHLLLYKAGTCHSSRKWLLFSIMDKIWVCILTCFLDIRPYPIPVLLCLPALFHSKNIYWVYYMPDTLSDVGDTMINVIVWVLLSQTYNASGTKN